MLRYYVHCLFDLLIHNKEVFVNIMVYVRHSFSVVRGCQCPLSTFEVKEKMVIV